MKKHFTVLTLCAVLGGSAMLAEVNAQEHKHEETKAQQESSENKSAPPAKVQSMPCCEMMEKMGEVKEGMPMKGDMKAQMQKMEQMKAMKEKMAEKMKSTAGDSPSEKTESKTEATKTPEKNTHQH